MTHPDPLAARAAAPAEAVVLRPALVADGPAISALIQPFAERDLMLPRPLPALYEAIRDFTVLSAGGEVVGCVALHVFDASLGELKSLAVRADWQGQGWSAKMVRRTLDEAVELGLRQVFALVLKVGLFERLGFRVVDKSVLPQKVWGECIFCPKFHRCDETAVLWEP